MSQLLQKCILGDVDYIIANRKECKPLHLAICAEQQHKNACIVLKDRVDRNLCSKQAKEYLNCIKEYSVEIFGKNYVWKLQGNCHKSDGPAVEKEDGTKYWYLNGKLHRKNGPAVEKGDGTKEWWLNDVKQDPPFDYTIKQFMMKHGFNKVVKAVVEQASLRSKAITRQMQDIKMIENTQGTENKVKLWNEMCENLCDKLYLFDRKQFFVVIAMKIYENREKSSVKQHKLLKELKTHLKFDHGLSKQELGSLSHEKLKEMIGESVENPTKEEMVYVLDTFSK